MSNALVAIDGKIERAERHINELDAFIQAWFQTEPYRVEVEDDPNTSERVRWILREQRTDPVPVIAIGILIGDIVHNLRVALDHLACALVARSHAPITQQTGFPIFRDGGVKSAQQVKSLVRGKVHGARQHFVDKLSTLEPYEGGREQMLWALHYLDVVDKHRVLVTAAAATAQVSMNVGAHHRTLFADAPAEEGELARSIPDLWLTVNAAETTYPLEDRAELTSAPREGSKPYDQFKFPIYIALGEPEILKGEAVLPTLAQLVSTVRGTVDLFRPDL